MGLGTRRGAAFESKQQLCGTPREAVLTSLHCGVRTNCCQVMPCSSTFVVPVLPVPRVDPR